MSITSLGSHKHNEHNKTSKQIADSQHIRPMDTDDSLQSDSEMESVLSDYSIDLDVSIDESDISNSYTASSYSSIHSMDSDDNLQSLTDEEHELSDSYSHMDEWTDESDLLVGPGPSMLPGGLGCQNNFDHFDHFDNFDNFDYYDFDHFDHFDYDHFDNFDHYDNKYSALNIEVDQQFLPNPFSKEDHRHLSSVPKDLSSIPEDNSSIPVDPQEDGPKEGSGEEGGTGA
eukprot:sb/3469501/